RSPVHDTKSHLLERAEPGEDAPARPRRVDALWRCQYLYSHILHRQTLHLLEQPVAKPLGQRGSTREHNVAIERLPQVHVCSVDGLDHDLMYARILKSDNLWVK